MNKFIVDGVIGILTWGHMMQGTVQSTNLLKVAAIPIISAFLIRCQNVPHLAHFVHKVNFYKVMLDVDKIIEL